MTLKTVFQFKIACITFLLILPFRLYGSLTWPGVKKEIKTNYSDVNHLSIEKFRKMLSQRKKIILIDARAPIEYKVSCIKNALNITSIGEIIKKFPDKHQTIVCYCSVGYRSARFVQSLQKKGYKNIYNLLGSIFEWANSGYPVYRGAQKVEAVHPFNQEWGTLLDKKFH